MSNPLKLNGARKHGVSDDDMLHAYRNVVAVYEMDDGMVMVVGGNRAGHMVEVGYVFRGGVTLIIHAMRPARSKFLPKR